MTFKKGESGNPNGRPAGTGQRQQLFNSFVAPHSEALLNTALNMAISGNEAMLRLFLERMLPARPTDEPIDLDITSLELTKTDSILSLGKTIITGVANAELTPTEARVLMSSLDTQSKLIETHELEQRVVAIEKTLKRRK